MNEGNSKECKKHIITLFYVAESEPMNNYFEEWKSRTVKRAEKRAGKRSSENIACNCLRMGKLTHEDIAKATSLSLNTVRRLAEHLKEATA